ncbi:MAG: MFS transporter, partial [Thermoleophilia bacterium]
MTGRRGRDGGGTTFLLTPLGIVFTTVLIDLIGFGIVLPILPLWAEDFGASPVEIGVITASYAVMQLIFAPILGRVSDRHGRRPVILLSLVGTVVAFLMIGFAQGLLIIFIARVLQGIAGASYAAAQAYVADVTTPKERAHGMGMIGAAFGLGFLLGPAIGALFAVIDPRAPFFA